MIQRYGGVKLRLCTAIPPVEAHLSDPAWIMGDAVQPLDATALGGWASWLAISCGGSARIAARRPRPAVMIAPVYSTGRTPIAQKFERCCGSPWAMRVWTKPVSASMLSSSGPE